MVNVVTTHLKAGRGFGKMRITQANQLVDKFSSLPNLILAGDINDEPDSKALSQLKPVFNQASQMAFGADYDFTTWKYRAGTGDQIRTIDYVFTSKVNGSDFGITGVHRYLAMPHRR